MICVQPAETAVRPFQNQQIPKPVSFGIVDREKGGWRKKIRYPRNAVFEQGVLQNKKFEPIKIRF